MPPKRPVFLFAFANDDAYRLRLEKEERAAREALSQADRDERIKYLPIGQTKLEDIYKACNRYHPHIHLFHYCGHSDGDGLHLSGGDTQKEPLAKLLSQQPLKLVFLNGCANDEQVDQLLAAGIPAVIATRALVGDEASCMLAESFYQALAAGKSIRQAFDTAQSYVQQKSQNPVDIQHRGLALDRRPEADFAWGLYYREETALEWQIPIQQEELSKDYQGKKINKYLGVPPFEPEIFLGREADLEAIHQKLFAGDNLLLLVNGEGGIGKTTIASVYYRQYERHYQHLAWVFAGDNLQEALLTLAIPLQVDFPDRMPNEQRLALLLEAMNNLDRPCLLVIDNANRLEGLQRNYLALRSCRNFHVLLTTRITEFERAATHRIAPLEKQKAIELFKKHYPRHQAAEDTLLELLLPAVGYNTLVIELLAKNLRNFNRLRTRYQLSDLLRDLQGKHLLALAYSGPVNTAYQAKAGSLRQEQPEDIIAAMYDLSELSEAESGLLSVFAVLPAENISFAILTALLPDAEQLDETLIDLAQKGWIDHDEQNAAFKVSPVVQEITQRKNSKLLADGQALLSGLINMLDYETGIGHFLNCTYEEAALFARYAENVVRNFRRADNALAILCERIGNFHKTTGNYDLALIFYDIDANLSKKLYEEYPQVIEFKNGLAVAYEKLGQTHADLGNLDHALNFFKYETQLFEELYQADPQNVDFKNNLAISYSNFGQTHSDLGNLDQALIFYQQYNLLEKELFEAYPQNVAFKNGLAISYSKLGSTQAALGNLGQALNFYQQYNLLKKELYEAYPQNVAFKNGLAISYEKLGQTQADLGNLEQALNFFEQRSTLGKELYEAYPQNVSLKNGLAISYSKLGQTQDDLGNLDQALIFYQQYNLLEKELFEVYPQNVAFKNGLAISYWKSGDYHRKIQQQAEARSYFQQAEKLWSELAAAFPAYAQFQKFLGIVQEDLKEL